MKRQVTWNLVPIIVGGTSTAATAATSHNRFLDARPQKFIKLFEAADWMSGTEYANEYCPMSGAPVDEIIDALLAIGLELKDIHHLEYLSNRSVLNALPGGFRYLEKGNRHHSALYMRTWASALELEMNAREKADTAAKSQPIDPTTELNHNPPTYARSSGQTVFR